MIAQVQREGKFLADSRGFDAHLSRRMTNSKKSRQSSAFSLEGIHRERLVASAAGVDHMILKAAYGSLHPGIDYIECQRRVNAYCRMQRRPRLPRAIAHSRDKFSLTPGRAHRNGAAVASHRVAIGR